VSSVGAGSWRIDAIARRLAKLRGRSIEELYERAMQRVSAELELRRLSRMVGEPSDEQLQAWLDPQALAGGTASAETLHAHFINRTTPRFFAGVRDGSTAAELRLPRWTMERTALFGAADRIMAGRFDLLGHEGLSFGTPIDWHLDPVSGRRAPRTHWSRIPYLDAEIVGDHKVIWELNRHQHFVVLGRAYQVSGKAHYAVHFAEQLTSWMDANPPKEGVNWASSLEVAYRAISWLWALELFRDAEALTPLILQRAVKYLYLHGRHLERYLSLYFSPNTHLTGEALGLLYLGLLLPELRRARQWRERGWLILETELPRQVHEDGVYFEHASYYHRYTVDIYLHAVLLARQNGQQVPSAMLTRLGLAVDHLADLTRPDGTIPLIGDDDGGMLVSLEERNPADVRAALGTASIALERPDYAVVAGGATQETLWLLGPDATDRVRAASGGEAPRHLSRLYRQGGYAVMRDRWGAGAHHLVVDAGPLGAMNCGHAHSDALSFELTAFGCPMLVDPGTFTYTASPAERDAFRHSAAHNTVTVDGASASVPDGAFSWAAAADARVDRWWTGTQTDYFAGSHDGFLRLPDPAVHRRQLLFARSGYWAVVDTILAEEEHETVAHFHTAVGSRLTALDASSAQIDRACTGGSARLGFFVAGDVASVQWGEGWVSPVYGTKSMAPAIRVASRGAGRRVIVTLLVPETGDGSVAVRELPGERGCAVAIDHPKGGGSDLLLVRNTGVAQAGSVEMEAELALIRRDAGGRELRSVALFGDSARLSVDGVSFEAAGAAEFVRRGADWSVEGAGRVVVR
jgi:Heparinase II/III-like protein/Heparinase II/III N-terminus